MVIALMASYGDVQGQQVQRVVISICDKRKRRIIAHKVWEAETDLDEATDEMMDFVALYPKAQLQMLNKLLPFEESICNCCGEISVRVPWKEKSPGWNHRKLP